MYRNVVWVLSIHGIQNAPMVQTSRIYLIGSIGQDLEILNNGTRVRGSLLGLSLLQKKVLHVVSFHKIFELLFSLDRGKISAVAK